MELTPDEYKVSANLAIGKSDVQAYKDAMQCSIETANGNASAYMQRHPIVRQTAIQFIMKRADLTIDKALDVVAGGMQAEYVNKYGKQVDYANRLEASKVLLKLHGELREGTQVNIDNREQTAVILDPSGIAQLDGTLGHMDKIIKKVDNAIDIGKVDVVEDAIYIKEEPSNGTSKPAPDQASKQDKVGKVVDDA